MLFRNKCGWASLGIMHGMGGWMDGMGGMGGWKGLAFSMGNGDGGGDAFNAVCNLILLVMDSWCGLDGWRSVSKKD